MPGHLERTEPLGTISEGTLVFGREVTGARLHAEPAPDRLFTASFPGHQPAVTVDEPAAGQPGPATVQVRFPRGSAHRGGRVALNPTVTWAIRIDGGATDLDADLTGIRLSAIHIRGRATGVALRLPAARGRVPVLIERGANNVTIQRPAGTGATLTIGGGGADVTFDERQFGAVNSGIRLESGAGSDAEGSKAERSGAAGYDIQVETGSMNLTVATDQPADSGGGDAGEGDGDGGAKKQIAVLLSPAQLDDAAQRWLPRLRRRATSEYRYVFLALAVAVVLGLTFFRIGSLLPESFFAIAITEVGIALWTAVFVVFFLQLGVDALKWSNRRSIADLERILTEHGRSVPPDPDQTVDATAAKLDRVLARLDEIEQRLADRDRDG